MLQAELTAQLEGVTAELERLGFHADGSEAPFRRLFLGAEASGTIREAIVLEVGSPNGGPLLLVLGYARFHEALPLSVVRLAHASNPELHGLIDGAPFEDRIVRLSKHARPSTFAAEIRLFSISIPLDGESASLARMLRSRLGLRKAG